MGRRLADDVPGADFAQFGVLRDPAEDLFRQEVDELDHALARRREQPPHQEHVALLVNQRFRPLVLVERHDGPARFAQDHPDPVLMDDFRVGDVGQDLPGGPFPRRVALFQEGRIRLEERRQQRDRPLELTDDGRFVHAGSIANAYSFLSSVFWGFAFSASSFWTASGTSSLALSASVISLRRVREKSTWLPWKSRVA